jgi:hypothetical protein
MTSELAVAGAVCSVVAGLATILVVRQAALLFMVQYTLSPSAGA